MTILRALTYAEKYDISLMAEVYVFLFHNWQVVFPDSDPYAELRELDEELHGLPQNVTVAEIQQCLREATLDAWRGAGRTLDPISNTHWRSPSLQPLSSKELEIYSSALKKGWLPSVGDLVNVTLRMVLDSLCIDYLKTGRARPDNGQEGLAFDIHILDLSHAYKSGEWTATCLLVKQLSKTFSLKDISRALNFDKPMVKIMLEADLDSLDSVTELKLRLSSYLI